MLKTRVSKNPVGRRSRLAPVVPARDKQLNRRQVAPPGPVEGAKIGVLEQFSGTAENGCRWTLTQGNAKTALAILPDRSVNCVVTSPPYYCQRDYDVDGQIGHERTIQGYVDEVVGCFREIRRIVREDGVVFLNLGDTFDRTV